MEEDVVHGRHKQQFMKTGTKVVVAHGMTHQRCMGNSSMQDL
jgi:hypothetical protein